MTIQCSYEDRGFALVLTLSLLALLMLALVALSTLVGVNGQISTVTAAQARAQHNALLGLGLGRSDLQKHAGDDSQITGMAGITGIAAHASNTTRNWCGVWRSDGSFVTWLTSGAQTTDSASLKSGVSAVTLAGNGANGSAGSVGASTANSEHVIAGKLPIVVSEIAAAPGTESTIGSYAFLVLDEGVKISAYSPSPQLIIPGVVPLIMNSTTGSVQERLRSAVDSYSHNLPALISFEQLSLIPTPAVALTQSVLQDNFHHATLTSLTLIGGDTRSGAINLNTTSPHVWGSILETYNSVPGVTPFSTGDLSSLGASIADGFPSSFSGKAAGGPFTNIIAFATSSLLADHLPPTITPEDFIAAMNGMLVVRSDTFRVRAYGEALDPLDGITIQAVAYCEAILQRTPDLAPNGMGRKFVVTYFRWLGPDDI